jgi:acyl carrier protein
MSKQFPKTEEIETWLSEHLSELLGIPLAKIDTKTNFDRYGLDSSAAISMTESLSNFVGHDLQPTLLKDYPTIQLLAQRLTATAE